MIPDDDKISSFQLGIFIYNTILGVGIITLPAALTKEVGQDAWLLTIISGLICIILVYIMCIGLRKSNSKGFVSTMTGLYGKFFGTILAFPVGIYFLVFASFVTRIFAETTKIYLLNNTPLEFIIAPLLVLAVFLARTGIEPISRFYEAVTPVTIVIIIIILLVPLPKSNFSNLRPFLAAPIVKYIKGTGTGIFAFLGFDILLVLFPYVRDSKKILRASVFPILFVTIVYTIIVIETIAKLGVRETQALIYPTLNLVKSSEVPGAFVERLEGLLLPLWVLFIFTSVVSYIYGFSVVMGDIFNEKKRKHIVSMTIPILYIISLSGGSVVELFNLVDTISKIFGTYIIIFIPLSIILMSFIRGGGKKKNEA